MKFQTDINTVGSQIKSLQDNCLAKQIKINNRQAVEERLTKFIEGVNIPDPLFEYASKQ